MLNDNERRAPQWRRLLGEYLTPRLGGAPDAWARANVSAFERDWARYLDYLASAGAHSDIDTWVRADRALWLADMCEQVGVATPPDAAALAHETGIWVSERVRAEIPGAIDAVRALAARGLRLHMASGGLSWELDPYLRGMGIRDCVERLYGPDLVRSNKNGPHFYEALLADSATDPATAAVVEDGAHARAWAEAVGLRSFGSLADLVAALD